MDNELKLLLAEHLTSAELVEFLNLNPLDVIEAFEDNILDNLSEVLEHAGIPNFYEPTYAPENDKEEE